MKHKLGVLGYLALFWTASGIWDGPVDIMGHLDLHRSSYFEILYTPLNYYNFLSLLCTPLSSCGIINSLATTNGKKGSHASLPPNGPSTIPPPPLQNGKCAPAVPSIVESHNASGQKFGKGRREVVVPSAAAF
jgi:hypothetical protein